MASPLPDSPSMSHTQPTSTDDDFHPSESCAVAKQLLRHLHEQITSIPDTLPPADERHPLAVFAGNPADHVNIDQDDWEDVLNPMMHQAFGYGAGAGSENELKG